MQTSMVLLEKDITKKLDLIESKFGEGGSI